MRTYYVTQEERGRDGRTPGYRKVEAENIPRAAEAARRMALDEGKRVLQRPKQIITVLPPAWATKPTKKAK